MKIKYSFLVIAIIVCAFTISVPVGSTRGQNQEKPSHSGFHTEGDPVEPSADLEVAKTAPDQVRPGDDITYEITVANIGPDLAQNATLNDVLPPGLTFVSISSAAGWICQAPSPGSQGTVTCTNQSLPVTEGDVFTVVVHVSSDTPTGTFFTNTATISTTTLDPNDENNSSTAVTFIPGNSADITVSKTANSDETPVGHPLNYTIQVGNIGPDAAENASMNDTLPNSVNFVSLSAPAGWTCLTPSPGQGGTISCSIPSLPVTSGEVFVLVVSVRGDTPPDTVIVNTGTVRTNTPEISDENNSSTAFSTVIEADPSAADGKISGQIVTEDRRPVEGVAILLEGTQSRRTITDANGLYEFDKVENSGLYTVTPSRANYGFAPGNRSFSLVGNSVEGTFSAHFNADLANPLDTPEYFVRQQYVDVLGREPDEAGFTYWTDQINQCTSGDCARSQRTGVASAFFVEREFRDSGAFIYNVYQGALGRRPEYAEYSTDRTKVIGGPTLEEQKRQFAEAFVGRGEFVSRYANDLTASSFVDAMLAYEHASGIDLSNRRDSLISIYDTGGSQTQSRALVLRELADSGALRDANYSKAFVLVEYFGYLRRNPDRQGYDFWVNVLNTSEPGAYRAMVCSFITSTEYQRRFSSVVSHNNTECTH